MRKTLERCRQGLKSTSRRKGNSKEEPVQHPHLFAQELAYVIERSGAGTEKDSKQVLYLYLEGVVSLPHAVEYVERNSRHSSLLWDILVSYCLNTNEVRGKEIQSNGKIFGSLLEVAAKTGADLSHLVSKIPANLRIDGIRHRLVAAISDYQMKVKMYEGAYKILSNDKVELLREQCHRSRRGTRVDLSAPSQKIVPEEKNDDHNVKIVLKPWREGKARLITKRKMRQRHRTDTLKTGTNIGMHLPHSLEIR